MKNNSIVFASIAFIISTITTAHAYPEDNFQFNRTGISSVYAKEYPAIFFIKAGRVVPVGENSENQRFFGIPEEARENVVKVVIDTEFSFKLGAALRRDGRVAVWGPYASDTEDGEFTLANYDPSAEHLRNVTNVVDIAIMEYNSKSRLFVLLEDGTVHTFDDNNTKPVIELPPEITNPVALFSGEEYLIVLDASGIARVVVEENELFGVDTDILHALTGIETIYNEIAVLADGSGVSFQQVSSLRTPHQTFLDGLEQPIAHSSSSFNSGSLLVVLEDGQLVGTRLSGTLSIFPPDLANNAWQVAIEHTRAYGIDRNGIAYTWGNFEELPGFLNSPMVHVAFGDSHAVMVRGDGTIRGWGDDTHRQTTGLNGVTNAIAVAADANYSVALLADGTVVGAGENTHGQLTNLDSFSDIIDIAAGETHLLLTKRDGTVTGNGNDADGRISGLASLTHVLDIEAGFDHSIARYGDREIFCVGNNAQGQCNIPTVVTDANYVLDIAAGYQTSAAVTYDRDVAESSLQPGAKLLHETSDGSCGLPGALHFWGQHTESRYVIQTTPTDFENGYYGSIALADTSNRYAFRLSNHVIEGDIGTSSDNNYSYRGGYQLGNIAWQSPEALSSFTHLMVSGGNFHACSLRDKLLIFPDKDINQLNAVQRSVLVEPNAVYELASDNELSTLSLLQASQPGPGIEIRTLANDRYIIETTTNLMDEDNWTTLPNESATRFYRLRKQ